MNNKILQHVVLTAITLVIAFAPVVVMAQFGNTGNCTVAGSSNTGVGGGLDDLNNCSQVNDLGISNSRDGVIVLIGRFINWGLYLSGAVAVVFIIIGGFRYIISAGSQDGAKAGKGTLINALIGLVIIILAYVIVNVVVNFFRN